jgi:hypothetical protein
LGKTANDTTLAGILGELIAAKTAALKTNWLNIMKQDPNIPVELHALAEGYKNIHTISTHGDMLTMDINYTSPHPSIPLAIIPEPVKKSETFN